MVSNVTESTKGPFSFDAWIIYELSLEVAISSNINKLRVTLN